MAVTSYIPQVLPALGSLPALMSMPAIDVFPRAVVLANLNRLYLELRQMEDARGRITVRPELFMTDVLAAFDLLDARCMAVVLGLPEALDVADEVGV